MKILYCGLEYDHYDPRRGLSFEHQNFYQSLARLPDAEAIKFPFDRIPKVGRAAFNQELLEAVRREKPDLLFAFMYTDELEPRTLDYICAQGTKTIAWFADDYWRFWNYSRRWAPLFSWAITTAPQAVAWYKRAGFEKVILSQWACNTRSYGPRAVEKDIDVSFVGQYKPPRARILSRLRRAGIHVEAFGSGWPNGRISQEGMIEVFSRSKINLNLNARPSLLDPAVIARLFLRKSINRLVPDFHIIQNIEAYAHFSVPHIHARVFELAGCGAFVISGYAPGVEVYYLENKEMVFYRTYDELLRKIEYYLDHDDERERIARLGYERTVRDHTYEKRFEEIFRIIGLRS